MSVNKVILLGRIGKTPEIKYTPNGSAVANFSVATSESWKDKSGDKKEKTEWHNIVVWGKLAEIVGKYMDKGTEVYIEGKLQTRSWEDKNGTKRYTTEILAETVQMTSGGKRKDGESAKADDHGQDHSSPMDESVADGANFASDDIPF